MVGILVVLVVLGIVALPSLRQAVQRLGGTPRTEEQARREVMQPTISTPTDAKVKAQLYWLSPGPDTSLAATTIELSLSADPVERSKQLLNALIADAPTAESRTLPADAALLAFYLQPDGTAIADFSDELALKTPSGILSEQLTVDSIAQTLGANVNSIQRLKILVHGQEAETLAGHLDLSGVFPVFAAPAPSSTTGTDTAPATAPSAPTVPVPAASPKPNQTPTKPAVASPAPPAPATKNPK